MEHISGKIKRTLHRARRKVRESGIVKKAVVATVIASTMLSSASPVLAYAAEAMNPDSSETATVTLLETDNGTLSFDGTDETTLTVAVGSEVTVNVTPDNGYFADSLSVFDDSDEGYAVEVEDGSVTVTVESDTTVTAYFYEEGAAGSSAIEAVTVDETSDAYTSVEDYIIDHADPQYVGEVDSTDDLYRADLLNVTTTVVDGSKLPDATLDTLWADEDGDDVADNYTALLENSTALAILFELDPDSDYYVAWVGSDIDGAALTDWAGAENNGAANMRDDFIMDADTGLIYVPKSYTETDEDGNDLVLSSRVQLVYTVENGASEASFGFSANVDGMGYALPGDGAASETVTSAYTHLALTSEDAVTDDAITSVTINGIEYDSEWGYWGFDAESGELVIYMAPASIHTVTVNMTWDAADAAGNAFGNLLKLFATEADAASLNNIGTWEFSSAPSADDVFYFTGRLRYRDSGTIASGSVVPGMNAADYNAGNYEDALVSQALGRADIDLSNMRTVPTTENNFYRRATFSAGTTSDQGTSGKSATMLSATDLALICSHIGVNTDFTRDPNYNVSSDEYNDYYGQMRVWVASVSGSTAIIGCVIPTVRTQSGCGFFEIDWTLGYGGITLVKSSANTSITSGNDMYSLSGAVYGVYSNSSCTNLVTRLTTNSNGRATTGTTLEPGTYYVKEITAPEGYYVDSTTHKVTVNGGETTTLRVSDTPANDPVSLIVGKYDGETGYLGESNLPTGSASLANAEFTVEYYDTLDYDSYEELTEAGIEPTRSWVVKTDSDGFAYLSEDYLVSGDEFYYVDGSVTLPRGTVVIYESKAPTGYVISDEVSFQKIQEDPASTVITYNEVEVPEQVYRSDIEFQKKSDDGSAALSGVVFRITSTTTGESHIIVTDENGYFSSASAWNKHTDDTNANDDAVTFNEDGTYTINEDALDATAGLWFGTSDADDSLGALPYDTYTIEELRCSANEGHALIKETSVIVSRNGVTIDLGTLVDQTPEIGTTAYDGDDSDNYLGVGHVKLVDRVSYTKLTSGETYTITGQVYDAETGEAIEVDGEPVTASETFTADGTYGSVYIEFEFDSYDLIGKTLVVFEELTDSTDSVLAEHKDLNDIDQQVTVLTPEIGTTAVDGADGDSTVMLDPEATVVDTVSYRGLTAGNTYTVTGTLVDKETGEALLDAEGNEITASAEFVAEASSGTVEVTFTFDATLLEAGDEAVAFESLSHDGHEIAVHADINDESQTVTFDEPEIGTTAVDGADGDKNVVYDPEGVIIDTVAYDNLVPGKEYTVTGKLMDKETGEALLDAEGNEITASATFTPESASGTVDVTFEFDATLFEAGDEIVVFESLYRNGIEVATHADINDESQTVTITEPEVGTTAVDGHDGDKSVVTDSESTIVDTVAYDNLVPGKEYTVTGTLYVKSYDEDGNVVEEKLTVPTGETSYEVYDADTDTWSLITDLYSDIVDITVDEDGTLSATRDGDEGTLTYEDGAWREVALEEPVTAIATFVPESASGTVEVTFTFDSSAIADGTEVVVFESLYRNGIEVATHADINDESQTVTFKRPDVGTTATDGLDGDKTVVADAETSITDTVEYEGTITGNTYTMAGILMDADTGLPILTGEGSELYSDEDVQAFMDELTGIFGLTVDEDGTVTLPATVDVEAFDAFLDENADLLSYMVVQSETFVSETEDGTMTMEFAFNANDVIDRLSGETKNVVVFEVMFKGSFEDETAPVAVASETDLTNEDQTVVLTPSSIGTTATDASDGDHELMAQQDATIIDTVTYEGLVPGKEYVLKATLMDKETGEALLVNDQTVTAEVRFTPNNASGSIDVELTFDASDLAGHDLVVFEELYKQSLIDGEVTDVLTAEHKDIDDENQTVAVTGSPEGTTAEGSSGSTYGKTGGSNAAILVIVAVLIAAAGGLGYYGFKTRRAAVGESEVDDASGNDDTTQA